MGEREGTVCVSANQFPFLALGFFVVSCFDVDFVSMPVSEIYPDCTSQTFFCAFFIYFFLLTW